jgi:hypothetical protein
LYQQPVFRFEVVVQTIVGIHRCVVEVEEPTREAIEEIVEVRYNRMKPVVVSFEGI